MGYGNDDRPDNRWRDRDRYRGRDDERGFFERAGDEVRSWFHDDDERGRRQYGDRGRSGGSGSMGGGWGNQRSESWSRERPGEPGYGDAREVREGWFTASEGGERGRRWGAADGSRPPQGDHHDPHYSEWRRRQIEALDRDYEEYRREHQSKFESDFGSWRSRRQSQRQMLGQVSENMEVVGADGGHVGTVDKVGDDRIVLNRKDENAAGIHYSLPCSWVEAVEENRVTLNRTAEQAMTEWKAEDRGRALFEREESGQPGAHVLNRSFAGTYGDRKD